jgi:peptide/nickel transport system substrate-binding protein
MGIFSIVKSAVLGMLAAYILAGPAVAQTAAKTLRLALQDPIRTIDEYSDSKPENSLLSSVLYSSLLWFDARAQTVRPGLAKSWARINPTTIEFELRDDVTWHDGEKVDADDVVALIAWISDDNSKYGRKNSFTFMKSAEKLSATKVRITMKEPTAVDLITFAQITPIYPEHVFAPLADKADFGRNPVGTGPYRATSVDRNKGIFAEKFKDYRLYGFDHPETNIEKFTALPINDAQTQVAQFLTGAIDVVRDLPPDQVRDLIKDKKYALTVSDGLTMAFLQLDASGRSGKKELQDTRVRRALHMAIDRKTIASELIWGGGKARPLDAFCVKPMAGCEHATKAPDYDPAAARKLLAEAGYANGFELTIYSTGERNGRNAQAVAGYLTAVGVKTSVRVINFPTLSDLQRDGKLEAYVATYPPSIADVDQTMNRFFAKGRRDFTGDPMLNDATETGASEVDVTKRNAIYRAAFDKINTEAYALPLSNFPILFTHTADLAIRDDSLGAWGAEIFDFSWK